MGERIHLYTLGPVVTSTGIFTAEAAPPHHTGSTTTRRTPQRSQSPNLFAEMAEVVWVAEDVRCHGGWGSRGDENLIKPLHAL